MRCGDGLFSGLCARGLLSVAYAPALHNVYLRSQQRSISQPDVMYARRYVLCESAHEFRRSGMTRPANSCRVTMCWLRGSRHMSRTVTPHIDPPSDLAIRVK